MNKQLKITKINKNFIGGLHTVMTVLQQQPNIIKKLYLNPERKDKVIKSLLELAKYNHIPVEKLTELPFEPNFNHQGILAHISEVPLYNEGDLVPFLQTLTSPPFILILDCLTDPHNLGACLRTAEAAGVHLVIIPKDKSAALTTTVHKVACGATILIPVLQATNLARLIQSLKKIGIWVYGAAAEASTNIYSLDCKIPLAIVIGSEDNGLRHLTRQYCDNLFSLPVYGQINSLNASVAAGISLYEVVRQRYK